MAGLAALQGAVSGLSSMLNNIGSGFKAIGELVSKFIEKVKSTAKDVSEAFSNAWESVKEKWNASVVEPLQPFFDWLGDIVSSVGEWFSETFTSINDAFKTFMEDPWGNFIDWIEGAVDSVSESWNNGLSSIGDFIGGLVDGAKEKLGAFGDWVSGIFTSIGEWWWENVSMPILNGIMWAFEKVNDFGEWVGGVFESIGNLWTTYVSEPIGGMWDWVMDKVAAFGEFVWGIISPILDAIDDLSGGFLGDAVGTVGGWLGFSEGGIASGPTSGYPAILHGTEAVVPLSGGRSIPVEMKGGGGGGGSTFNMTFNLSGLTDRTDKRQLAREIGNMVQQEVARSIGGSTMARRY